MTAFDTQLSKDDRQLLVSYYPFYRSLETGMRAPKTEAQHHFIGVCRGEKVAKTEHEKAYQRFKRIVAEATHSEEELVACGFTVPAPIDGAGLKIGFDRTVEIPIRPCAGCGRPIPVERLKVIPDAVYCVCCQENQESDETDSRISEVECPRCAQKGIQSRLVWRTARDPEISGYFLGCSRFPHCRYVDRS